MPSTREPKIMKDEPKEKLVKGYDLESKPFLCPNCKGDLAENGLSVIETGDIYGTIYFNKNGTYEDYSQHSISDKETNEVYCRDCNAKLNLGSEIWQKLPEKIEKA